MGTYVKAAAVSDFRAVNKKKVDVQGNEIMLAKVGGNFYAIDNQCPHLKGNLSAGTLEGTIITCPRHASQFDVTDGRNIRWLGPGIVNAMLKSLSSSKPVKSYKVQVRGDDVMVEI
jgi:3-phenylpropionate/trans-cinnamate dioxygenase ferredoxin component